MLKIEQSKYEELRKNIIDKKILYKILLEESMRWSQNFKNWCIKRDLQNIYKSIFKEDNISSYNRIEISKIIYDYCNGTSLCAICGKEAKYFTFKEGYNLTCSKECDYKQRSQRQTGENNTYFRWCNDKNKLKNAHIKQSLKIKEKIKDGSFTPCATNSWANSRCLLEIDNCELKFRSTWEAMFWLLGKLPYEKIRIPYINEKNINSIYIVDFHDEINKKLYEIKPSKNRTNKRNILKEKAAIKWCEENNYNYEVITEKWLKTQKSSIINLTKNEKILKALEYL
jgi:hypothetical protein